MWYGAEIINDGENIKVIKFEREKTDNFANISSITSTNIYLFVNDADRDKLVDKVLSLHPETIVEDAQEA